MGVRNSSKYSVAGRDFLNREVIQSMAPAWPLKLTPIGSEIRRMQAAGSAARIASSPAAIVWPYTVTGSVGSVST